MLEVRCTKFVRVAHLNDYCTSYTAFSSPHTPNTKNPEACARDIFYKVYDFID